MSERITAAEFRKKAKKPRVDREGPIHREVLAYLRKVLPDAVIHHSANESHLNGEAAMWATVRKKRDGMVVGFPDLIVLPYAHVTPMFFEVKAEGGPTSPAQAELHEKLRTLGYRVAVVRSVDDTREALHEWGIPTMHVEYSNIPLRDSIS